MKTYEQIEQEVLAEKKAIKERMFLIEHGYCPVCKEKTLMTKYKGFWFPYSITYCSIDSTHYEYKETLMPMNM